jgi:transcriptional regulator with XRE-family HTH domain
MKKIFSKRLLELVGDQPVAAFARFVGIGQNSIDRYLKMQRTPNGDAIRQIAQAANVSADWLLGLSDQRAALRPAEYPLHAADPPARVAESPPPACPCCADKDRQIDRLMRVVENLSLNQRLPSPPCSSVMAKPASSYSRRAKS